MLEIFLVCFTFSSEYEQEKKRRKTKVIRDSFVRLLNFHSVLLEALFLSDGTSSCLFDPLRTATTITQRPRIHDEWIENELLGYKISFSISSNSGIYLEQIQTTVSRPT